MESLETTLDKLIDVDAYEKNTKPINALVLKVLLKVLEIINYFNTTYGFCHNDLSTSNIMVPKTGNVASQVKLIDFGISSVKFGNIELGKPLKSRVDLQYLILKLFTTLDINPNEFSQKLEKLLELPADTPIKTYIELLQGAAGGRKKKRTQRRKRSLRAGR
jgi:serine/threonine protein kinase